MAGALANLADRVIPESFVSQIGGEWHDRGTAELKQKDFGITPIRI
jgi:lipoprotein signal peptidase